MSTHLITELQNNVEQNGFKGKDRQMHDYNLKFRHFCQELLEQVDRKSVRGY